MVQALLAQPQRPQRDTAPRRYTDAPSVVEPDGYVWEWCPTHPSAKRGVVLQHRLVMEEMLGRFLTKKERVHHKNAIRHDNRPQNLELQASHGDHMRRHWLGKGRRSPEWIERVRQLASDPSASLSDCGMSPTIVRAICLENGIEWVARTAHPNAAALTEQSVREALQGRTTAEAARHLRTTVMTLHRRFGHLLHKRSSPHFLDQRRDEILAMLWQEHLTRDQIAERIGASRVTVMKAIRRWREQDATLAVPARQPNRRQHSAPSP